MTPRATSGREASALRSTALVLATSITLLAGPGLAVDHLPVVGPVLPYCPVLQDDAGSGRDARGTLGAQSLDEDGTYEGCIDHLDGADWYAIPVAAGDRVRVTLTELDCGRIEVRIDLDGTTRGVSDDAACVAEIVGSAASGEDLTYHLAVRPGAGAGFTGRYAFTIERAPDLVGQCGEPQNDGGSGHDATWADLADLGAGTAAGCFDEFDDVDVYRIHAEAGDRVTVALVSDTCMRIDHVSLGGGDADHQEEDPWEAWPEDPCDPWVLHATMLRTGSTPLHVATAGRITTYTIDVTLTPGET